MTTRALLAAVAITAMGIAPAFAQNTAPNTKPMTPASPAHSMPAQPEKKAETPGMPSKEMMQDMMEKMGNPGPNHQLLGNMVGEWTADCKFWMDPTPGAAPSVSKGTAVNSWEMGKRFVKQDFNGSFSMGGGAPEMPFHGLGYTGYDNTKQKFVSTWMDTMSTGIMYSEGTYDPSSKTFTFAAQCTDPMTNKPTTVTEVIKIVDENTHMFTMSGTGPDGKDMKMGEITYHRKGAKPMDTMDKPKDMNRTPATPATPAAPSTPKKTNLPG
jgi:hypothetical protein